MNIKRVNKLPTLSPFANTTHVKIVQKQIHQHIGKKKINKKISIYHHKYRTTRIHQSHEKLEGNTYCQS